MANLFKKQNTKNNKYVAFSFDDGPNEKITLQILKTLKKHNARATFFLVGSRIENYTISKNIYKKYNCEIGNHTWMHDDMIDYTENFIYDSVKTCQDVIKSAFDTDAKLMRAPGGNFSSKLLSALKKLGLCSIHWSLDSEDWLINDVDIIVENVVGKIKDGDIVLMHDKNETTTKALDIILNKLKKQGYCFVTVSELFEIKNIDLKPGTIYKTASKQHD